MSENKQAPTEKQPTIVEFPIPTAKKSYVPHPLQVMYRAGDEYRGNMYNKYKDLIRKLFIRPKNDTDDQVYVCSDSERCRLADMFSSEMSRGNHTFGGNDFGLAFRQTLHGKRTKVVEQFVDDFMLRPLLMTGRCFVAGGAVLRFLVNDMIKEAEKKADARLMFQNSDIDVFFTDEEDINTYMYYLKSKNVNLEKIQEKHDTYRVTSPTGCFYAPFLIQFTKTSTTSIYELMDDFDLPMCQIGIGNSMELQWTIGFEVLMEHMEDAVIHVTAYNNDAEQRKDYLARVLKFEQMGYHFKFVDDRTYYGRRPWTMEYYERKALKLTPSNDNTPLLLTLMEYYNKRCEFCHFQYMYRIAEREIAKKQQYEDDIFKNEANEEKKKKELYIFCGIIINQMMENAEKQFLFQNAFALHGNEKRKQLDEWRSKFTALYAKDEQERMKNEREQRRVEPAPASTTE